MFCKDEFINKVYQEKEEVELDHGTMENFRDGVYESVKLKI